MNATLTISRRCLYATDSQWQHGIAKLPDDQVVEPGEKLEYVAHTIGGNVKARRNGEVVVIPPGATVELRG